MVSFVDVYGPRLIATVWLGLVWRSRLLTYIPHNPVEPELVMTAPAEARQGFADQLFKVEGLDWHVAVPLPLLEYPHQLAVVAPQRLVGLVENADLG